MAADSSMLCGTRPLIWNHVCCNLPPWKQRWQWWWWWLDPC